MCNGKYDYLDNSNVVEGIKVVEENGSVTGYLKGKEIIKLGIYSFDKWTVGCSSCLPSDLSEARAYLEVMNKVFETVEGIREVENSD